MVAAGAATGQAAEPGPRRPGLASVHFARRMEPSPEKLALVAEAALERGNYALADTVLRHLDTLRFASPASARTYLNLAFIFGDVERARGYLAGLEAIEPDDPVIPQATAMLQWAAGAPRTTGPRYLLIKAWGFGFFADVDMVLSYLLLAEMTGRVPLVWWGENSLFRDEGVVNAWESFFEPVSSISIETLRRPGLTYCPPKWTAANLLAENVNKFEGDGARVTAYHFLGREADVCVADYHTGVVNLLPWAPPAHWSAGLDLGAVYRRLISTYLRPRREVLDRVGAFASRHLAGGPVLALHIRGSDKIREDEQNNEIIRRAREAADAWLARHERARLFLMTDSEPVAAEYAARLGPRLVMTDSLRTGSDQGTHYLGVPERTRLGLEVLVDAYIAARCDAFIGNGSSNVSCFVAHLKEWGPGAIDLIVGPVVYERNLMLHDW